MKKLLLAAASVAVLALAPAAWAQSNKEPVNQGYGPSGSDDHAGAGGHPGSGWLSGLTVITPVDPAYSWTEPSHSGESSLTDMNGNDHGRGTSYNAITGHDSGM